MFLYGISSEKLFTPKMKVCVKMRTIFQRLSREIYKSRIPLYELFEKFPPCSNDRPASADQTASDDGAAGAQPPPVVADPVPVPLDEQRLAEYLYMRYGKHARQAGSTTNAIPIAPFDALPDARKRTLLLLARDVQVLLTRVKHEGFVQGKEQAGCAGW
jgi:hypothetical protein